MTAAVKILVVDDEPPIRKLLRMGLAAHGYEVLEAMNGKSALELLDKKPDLVILDLGLPDIEGLELLRRIRNARRAARRRALEPRRRGRQVAALDLGADDYVTKPFGMDELLARMRAALRHQLQVHGERPVFHVGALSVDLVRRIVRMDDKQVKLSPKEYDLCAARAARRQSAHPQIPVARALGRAHRHAISTRLRAQLRRKIETTPSARTIS
jgi:two-component system KDP operon response regulator KdpE